MVFLIKQFVNPLLDWDIWDVGSHIPAADASWTVNREVVKCFLSVICSYYDPCAAAPLGENHAFRAKKFVEHSEQHVAKVRAGACGWIISGSEDQGRETMWAQLNSFSAIVDIVSSALDLLLLSYESKKKKKKTAHLIWRGQYAIFIVLLR